MTDDWKDPYGIRDKTPETAGPGLGQNSDTKDFAAAEGSIPSPAAHIQPDGPPRKKRGRPKRDKTKNPIPCESNLNKFKLQKRVYYPEEDKNKRPYGVLIYAGEAEQIGSFFIARFKDENPDGTVTWDCRHEGARYHYDMIKVNKFVLDDFIKALEEIRAEWFGGPRKIQERLEEVKQVSADSELSRKLRGYKGVL